MFRSYAIHSAAPSPLCLIQGWKCSAGLCAVAAAPLDISPAGWETDPES